MMENSNADKISTMKYEIHFCKFYRFGVALKFYLHVLTFVKLHLRFCPVSDKQNDSSFSVKKI